MYNEVKQLVEKAQSIVIIQAENPDGDSLGSALALEEILGDLGKEVHLFCAIEPPKYLRYANGWDRIVQELPKNFDLSIIVDTASKSLLEKAFQGDNLNRLQKKPLIVLDHHVTEGDLEIEATSIVDSTCVATGELVFKIARELEWSINPSAASNMIIAIMSDSLGLTTENTTAHSVDTVARLIEAGASISDIETRRREFNKKAPDILKYKGDLIERIEYHNDGQLALVHIPWAEIEKYSDRYNPSMLVLDEMRLVENVRIAIAIKTYPDGKLTAKIRCNSDSPVADKVAGFFGGGGHRYAAGFKIYEDYDKLIPELIGAVDKILEDSANAQTA
jgi:phosphoesterase RecJ-like protein